MTYSFLDAAASVQTADSSVVGGFHRPIVYLAGNSSVSGTVNIGTMPRVSVVGAVQEDSASADGDYGMFALGVRNDTVASTVSADKDYVGLSADSAGRHLIKPFAAEEARIEGYSSTTSTSQLTLVPAAGAGLRNYITDVWIANTGAATTLVTFKDNAGSILGYTIAPTAGGSNLPGLAMPIRTGANQTFDIQAGSPTSILYVTVKGYKAP